MSFEEILDHALAMLQRRGRLTYRTLQRQFHLDDDALGGREYMGETSLRQQDVIGTAMLCHG